MAGPALCWQHTVPWPGFERLSDYEVLKEPRLSRACGVRSSGLIQNFLISRGSMSACKIACFFWGEVFPNRWAGGFDAKARGIVDGLPLWCFCLLLQRFAATCWQRLAATRWACLFQGAFKSF